jgi:1-acyl-sn-glycerol-3-phosphate acyltransferase
VNGLTWDLLLYRFVRALVVAFARLFWRLDVTGLEHVPTDRAFVLAPVHRSNIDTIVVAAVTRRRLRYMGKDSLWKVDALGKLLSALGAFPVHRGSADREALRRCIAVVEAGEPLVIFPEGTRQSGPIVQPLFEGAAYVAARTGVPVVPVGIGGSEAAMPKGSKLLRPVKVSVVIGEPIEPPARSGEGGTGRAPRRAVHEVTERLAKELQALFDQAQVRAGA